VQIVMIRKNRDKRIKTC